MLCYPTHSKGPKRAGHPDRHYNKQLKKLVMKIYKKTKQRHYTTTQQHYMYFRPGGAFGGGKPFPARAPNLVPARLEPPPGPQPFAPALRGREGGSPPPDRAPSGWKSWEWKSWIPLDGTSEVGGVRATVVLNIQSDSANCLLLVF